jgi:hypothetical protein
MSCFNITEDEIRRYERDGAVVIRNVLDAEASRRLERGVEEAYQAQSGRATIVDGADGQGRTIVRDYASLASPALHALLTSGVIGRIGATLMRTSAAHLILDQIFTRPKDRSSRRPGIRTHRSCGFAGILWYDSGSRVIIRLQR